jgi:serine/threonine protein kinase
LGRLDRDLQLLKDPRFLNFNLGYLHDLGRVYNVGNVLINRDIKDANISDLFRSEEIDNSDKIDLGKVQM